MATTISNTRVLIGGIAAPLLYVSEHQINAVVPFEIAGQTKTTVQVETNGRASLPSLQESVTDADPGIFTLDGSGYGQAAALNEDGTVNSAGHSAAQGSVVSLFVTGVGAMQPAPTDGFVPDKPFARPALPVQLGFAEALFSPEVTYVGDAPTLVEGAVQINVRVPKLYRTGSQILNILVGDEQGWIGLNVSVFVR